jgi:hypothetical protein
MRFWPLLVFVSLIAPASRQDKADFKVSVTTTDRQTIHGTATLPATIKIKTPYGLATVPTAGISRLTFVSEDTWQAATPSGSRYDGTLDLPESITIAAKDESVELALNLINVVDFPEARERDAAPARVPAFKGFFVRKGAQRREPETALLLPDAKHLAFLDPVAGACLRVNIGTGAVDSVAIGEEPRHLALKDGKIYVCSSKVAAVIVIDAATFKFSDRIPIPDPAWFIGTSLLGSHILVHGQNGLITINAATGKVIAAGGRRRQSGFCVPTPDGTAIYTESGLGGVDGSVWRRRTGFARPTFLDVVGNRVYAWNAVYTPGLRDQVADLPVRFCLPHPSRSLILGAAPLHDFSTDSTVVAIFDEETFTPIARVPMRDSITALAATESHVVVLSPTSVYAVDLAAHVPKAAWAKPRARRTPIDPARVITTEEAAAAAARSDEGWKCVDADNLDAARKAFEAAVAADPWSDGAAGLGAVLARERKGIEALCQATEGPMRDPKRRTRAYVELARALGRIESGQAFRDAFVRDPRNPLLWRELSAWYDAAGNAYGACWAAAFASKYEPTFDSSGTVARFKSASAVECRACLGAGSVELTVEEPGSAPANVSEPCKVCGGAGKVWRRPCLDCPWTDLGARPACGSCNNAGYRWEGAGK